MTRLSAAPVRKWHRSSVIYEKRNEVRGQYAEKTLHYWQISCLLLKNRELFKYTHASMYLK